MPPDVTCEALQEELRARDKTIGTLIAAAESSQRSRGTALALLYENAALEQAVKRRTRELELEREQLQKALSDLKAAQAQLLQGQKLTAIGQLAAGIAHEINTPMQFIGDNVSFLRTAFQDLLDVAAAGSSALEAGGSTAETLAFLRTEVPQALEQTGEGIQRVTSIVAAMKDFSHPSGGKKQPSDVHACLDSTVTVARNVWKYVADVVHDYDRECPHIDLLRDEFNQVILNLVVNAADAISEATQGGTQGKGTITLRTRKLPEAVEVQVQDNGPGIPEDIRSRVFEPFFTTKAVGKGTGQGLAIAYSVIVERHGGEIGFDSELGRGTTFWMRLPLKQDAA
ncbi:MAG: HAMP domain-containing histidine kinase [Deltaproteobacteria bacterium]|nr:HAMP domain-containing histidine kinase [Deltaproteobacteria bacterium]